MQDIENLIANLNELTNKYNKFCEMLEYEEVILDKKLYLHFLNQKQNLEPLISCYNEFLNVKKLIEEFKNLNNQTIDNEKSLIENEILKLENEEDNLCKKLIALFNNFNALLEKVVVEIILNKNESSFLNFLLSGYENFCKNNNLEFKKIENTKNLQIEIIGFNAKKFFINEVGYHLFIDGEKENIIQVFVYENLENDYSFNEKDVVVLTFRSQGAGGQHINTTDSAIKVTHIPTNISTICQDERSQFQNKQKAIERLKEKVLNFYNTKNKDLIEKQKKEQLKMFNKNSYTKKYNNKLNTIITKDKKEFLLKDFLQGNILN